MPCRSPGWNLAHGVPPGATGRSKSGSAADLVGDAVAGEVLVAEMLVSRDLPPEPFGGPEGLGCALVGGLHLGGQESLELPAVFIDLDRQAALGNPVTDLLEPLSPGQWPESGELCGVD